MREVCRSSQETKQGPSLVSPCGFQIPAPSLPVLGNVGAQAPLRLCGGKVRDGYGDEQAWPHSPMLGGRLRCKCRIRFWRVTTDDALGWNGAPGSVGLDMRRRPTGDMFALGGSEFLPTSRTSNIAFSRLLRAGVIPDSALRRHGGVGKMFPVSCRTRTLQRTPF